MQKSWWSFTVGFLINWDTDCWRRKLLQYLQPCDTECGVERTNKFCSINLWSHENLCSNSRCKFQVPMLFEKTEFHLKLASEGRIKTQAISVSHSDYRSGWSSDKWKSDEESHCKGMRISVEYYRGGKFLLPQFDLLSIPMNYYFQGVGDGPWHLVSFFSTLIILTFYWILDESFRWIPSKTAMG